MWFCIVRCHANRLAQMPKICSWKWCALNRKVFWFLFLFLLPLLIIVVSFLFSRCHNSSAMACFFLTAKNVVPFPCVCVYVCVGLLLLGNHQAVIFLAVLMYIVHFCLFMYWLIITMAKGKGRETYTHRERERNQIDQQTKKSKNSFNWDIISKFI